MTELEAKLREIDKEFGLYGRVDIRSVLRALRVAVEQRDAWIKEAGSDVAVNAHAEDKLILRALKGEA